MITVTNEQWELIEEKYGRLISKICHNISGDRAIASYDDNLQDLRLAAMEAVAGFARKEDKDFEDFWGTEGFNKYIKTCLWNLKNKKGANITKKYPVTKNTVDINKYSDILVDESQDTSSIDLGISLDQITYKFTDQQKLIIETVTKDPTLLKPNGKVNIKKVGEELGFTWLEVRNVLVSLSDILQNKL
jgi:hypothetical protein